MGIRQPDNLIRVLKNEEAEFGDRDDAAMDLGAYDDPAAREALLNVARNPQTDEDLADRCGESLAEICLRQGSPVAMKVMDQLSGTAKASFIALIQAKNPHWLNNTSENDEL